jgi:hypothetical protein
MQYAVNRWLVSVALAATTSLTSLSACAPAPTGPRPVDVAAVRREIRDEMSHDWTAQGRFHGERKIVSMGHVTDASAVVYTDDGGKRYAETWVRAGGGAWQLKDVQPAG